MTDMWETLYIKYILCLLFYSSIMPGLMYAYYKRQFAKLHIELTGTDKWTVGKKQIVYGMVVTQIMFLIPALMGVAVFLYEAYFGGH